MSTSTTLYLYEMEKQPVLSYQESTIPVFCLGKQDISEQQSYAHTFLATALFHSQTESVFVLSPEMETDLLLSWKPLDLEVWFRYDTVTDRWGDVIVDDDGVSVPFEWQRFLHMTMDRMDRFVLQRWMEEAKLLSPRNLSFILSPRISERMSSLRSPTSLWHATQKLILDESI